MYHVNRPVTKLCPLKVDCEFRSDKVIPSLKKCKDNSLQRFLESSRPKRTAAVTGILKRL